MRATMAQINLHIHADLSAPLLFVIDAQFIMYVVQQSRLGRTVAKPKDNFSLDEVKIHNYKHSSGKQTILLFSPGASWDPSPKLRGPGLG